MKLAFFDAKPYDRPGFERYADGSGLEIKYFETKLNADTVSLARGFDAVCSFVNDTVDAAAAEALYAMGVRVIALRCAGFNQVDLRACRGKLRVFRVPAYSPYAVAEHAMALLLTSNRHTNRAYIRTRDFNFSLPGSRALICMGRPPGSSARARSAACLRRSAGASECRCWRMTSILPQTVGCTMQRCRSCSQSRT